MSSTDDPHVYDETEIESDGSQIEDHPAGESMDGHNPEDEE